MNEEKLHISWPRIITEGTAIVISILLAFAIQAWWEGVEDRRLEHEILVGLEEEFQTNVELLNQAIVGLDRQIELVEQLLSITGPEFNVQDEQAGTQSLANLLASNSELNLAEGALTTLISTLGLNIVLDYELRILLSTWPVQTRTIDDSRQNIILRFRENLMPYLWPRIPVRNLDALSTPEFSQLQSRHEFELAEIAVDLEFENILNEIFYVVSQAKENIADARDEASSILALIQAELAL